MRFEGEERDRKRWKGREEGWRYREKLDVERRKMSLGWRVFLGF